MYDVSKDIESYDKDHIVVWSSGLQLLDYDIQVSNKVEIRSDFMTCVRCKNRFEYVEPNLPNKEYKCYNCRL